MSTTIKYKGNTLATVSNDTKTLKTAGKYMEGDVELTDVSSTIVVSETLDANGGIIKTITTTDEVNLQTKTITPTSTIQTVNPDTGYDGFSQVVVNAASGAPNIQPLTITPSSAEQTFNNSSVDGYKPITVYGIPIDYVGVGIDRLDSSDLTVSGPTITAPAGYYENGASASVTTMTLPTSAASSATSGYTSKATIGRSTAAQYINIPPGYNSAGAYYVISAVANGSAAAPATISGTAASVSTGTNTLTLTKTVSVTPTVSAGYVSSGTAGNSSVSLTASVTTKAAATYHPSTTAQTIAASQYLTGAQTIAAVTTSNLSASNILSGVTIKVGDSSDDDCVASVTGNVVIQNYYTGTSAPSSSLGSNGDLYLQT